MGMNDFAPYQKFNTSFIVKNIITGTPKTINIFQYPIPVGCERDLLAIRGIGEADIRASLLKGEILHKLKAKEITIVYSDIDLLQFNDDQLAFLKASGIVNGLKVGSSQTNVVHEEDIQLVGAVNDVNTVFTIPSGKFIQADPYKIIVYVNGVKQLYLGDYFIAESGGPGTGYDTVILTDPPTTTPAPIDVITADYYVDNS